MKARFFLSTDFDTLKPQLVKRLEKSNLNIDEIWLEYEDTIAEKVSDCLIDLEYIPSKDWTIDINLLSHYCNIDHLELEIISMCIGEELTIDQIILSADGFSIFLK